MQLNLGLLLIEIGIKSDTDLSALAGLSHLLFRIPVEKKQKKNTSPNFFVFYIQCHAEGVTINFQPHSIYLNARPSFCTSPTLIIKKVFFI